MIQGSKPLQKGRYERSIPGRLITGCMLADRTEKYFCIDKERHRGTRHVFMEYVFGNKDARALGVDLVSGSNNEEQT